VGFLFWGKEGLLIFLAIVGIFWLFGGCLEWRAAGGMMTTLRSICHSFLLNIRDIRILHFPRIINYQLPNLPQLSSTQLTNSTIHPLHMSTRPYTHSRLFTTSFYSNQSHDLYSTFFIHIFHNSQLSHYPSHVSHLAGRMKCMPLSRNFENTLSFYLLHSLFNLLPTH